MSSKIIALADCNAFFVSCETVFNPALEGKPVVVLSGNDACVVSRSAAAKAIGIQMQAMGRSIQHLVNRHGLCVFSSNPSLYRDMSQRVMQTLAHFSPVVEVYSVDEAFLDLSGFHHQDLWDHGQQMRQTVKQWTGIPISIGIAPTKTLAKIANHLAKVDPATEGVVELNATSNWDALLATVEVGKVWGIGRQTADALKARGIDNALHLKQADQRWIKQRFSVITLRTVLELGGMSCLPVQQSDDPKQGMTVSRCFGRPVTHLADMKEAIAAHTSKLAEKLRQEGLMTERLVISMRTNRFAQIPQYEASQEVTLAAPTHYTDQLLPPALRVAEAIFKPGYEYYKAQVDAPELIAVDAVQGNLFEQPSEHSRRLMQTMDRINQKLGANSIKFGAVGLVQGWKTRAGYPSKRYTTCWSELPVVKASNKVR